MRKKLFTTVALCLSLSLLFGCNKNPNSQSNTDNQGNATVNTSGLSGEEIAKLLLADERLDSSTMKGSKDLFEARAAANYLFSSEFVNCLRVPVNYSQGTCTVNGNTYEWSNFTDYCNTDSFFESYETNIKGTVEATCSIIDVIKNDANITDKWLKYNNEDTTRLMLLVDGTSETLIEDNEFAVRICTRYTNESAQNVYEIYQYEKTNTFSYYFKYIPDYSYEYVMYDNNIAIDYLAGINNGGVWNKLCIGIFDVHSNVTYVMTGSSVSYVFDYSVSDAEASGHLSIASAGLTSDIISIMDDIVTIYPNSFSGINCLRVVSDNVSTDMNDLTADILFLNDTYATMAASPSIVLSNGNVIEPFHFNENITAEEYDALQNQVYYRHGTVSSGAEGYRPDLSFHVPGNNVTEKITNLNNYLNSVGISCKYDMSAIIGNSATGNALLNQFINTYQLNGMPINTFSNSAAAVHSYNSICTAKQELVASVNDYDLVLINKEDFLISNYDFSSVENIVPGTIEFSEDTINVSGLSFTLNNLLLIDEGTSYTIKLALAKKNEDGVYDPCQTVALGSDNEVFTAYESGDSFTLEQNASFSFNVYLEEGDYDLVAYLSTDNDIRVSEFVPITTSASAGTVYEGTSANITVNNDGTMTASYVFDYNISIEVDTTDATYTYQDIYDAFICIISDYGTATDIVEQLNEDGTYSEFTADTVPNDCTLRMAYTYDDNGVAATAYCTLILTSK